MGIVPTCLSVLLACDGLVKRVEMASREAF
jgi:hypothetical protein